MTKKTAQQKRAEKGWPEPAKGQVWKDCDPRCNGRKVRLVALTLEHAVIGRSRIRLDRIVAPAFEYVSG